MSGKLLLLPLDDRPVNLDLPLQLARVAGEALCVPPMGALGRFLTPGDTKALARWLAEEAGNARAAIISLDMLAYGGLVASRTPAVSAADALRRLDLLREMKRQQPQLRIYAFSVIMRLTITSADAETRAAGRDIFRYAVLHDQVKRLGDATAAAELAAVEARIPRALLEPFLAARARNHAVNRAAVDLLADGTLDYLALVQEDTAPTGLHVAEQLALAAQARERCNDDRWRIYAGTDEAAQTLLARCVLEETGLPFPVTPALRDAVAAESPALYEDVPLCETVQRHIAAVGGTLAGAATPLGVHTFTPPQSDLVDIARLPAPTWDAALAVFPPGDYTPWLDTLGDAPALADVAYCNGGDPWLLHALLINGKFVGLTSYAGWNTAGNTLGTTLAHAALRACALARSITPAMEQAHREALLVRLLDDGLYQSVIRGWAMQQAEESGASPLNLGCNAPEIERQVDVAMQALWRELCARYPLEALHCPFRAVLPWGRLFEVRILPAE